MLLGLFAALAASVCYGVATVLQAVSARAAPHTADVDPLVAPAKLVHLDTTKGPIDAMAGLPKVAEIRDGSAGAPAADRDQGHRSGIGWHAHVYAYRRYNRA